MKSFLALLTVLASAACIQTHPMGVGVTHHEYDGDDSVPAPLNLRPITPPFPVLVGNSTYDCPDGSVVATQADCPDPRPAGLYVSLSSETVPSETIPAGAASVSLVAIHVEAVGGTFPIDCLTFRLGGAVSNVDSAYLYAYDDLGYRLSDAKTFDPQTGELPFETQFRIPEGLAFDYVVRLDIAETVNAGDTTRLDLVSVKTDGDVYGSFPISGNTMTFTDQAVGTMHIIKDAFTGPTVNETDATIAQFTVSVTGEGGSLSRITLYSPQAMDRAKTRGTWGSYSLWDAGGKLADCATITQYLILCPIELYYPVLENEQHHLQLRTDLAGSAGDVTQVAIEEKADVVGYGMNFGFHMNVDISGYDDVDGLCADIDHACSFSTINP